MRLIYRANDADVLHVIDVMDAVPRTGWAAETLMIDVRGAVPRTGWTGSGNARSWPEHLSRREPLARASVNSMVRKRA